MNASIVIPTLNEKENLPNCLANLEHQVDARDEVIIVDGGSDDGTIEYANSLGCKVLVAEGTSIGVARQIGTEEAQNEVVVSTDADSLPPDGWLDRIKSHFEDDEDLAVLWGNIKDVNGVPIRNLVGKFSTLDKGASGNNTAFRKSAYDEMGKGYPDSSFLEDVAIIQRLSKYGKAVRDKDLVMVMNMERRRYQTVPIAGLCTGIMAIGSMAGGSFADYGTGFALGNMGTEVLYENMTGTNLHHDQVGAMAMTASKLVDHPKAKMARGAGLGVIAHHVMTEGLSALPTQLQKNTDLVIGGE